MKEKSPPRLLFLARPFPPKISAGSVRGWNIAKYLSLCGWKVTVVTPDPRIWGQIENASEVDQRIAKYGITRLLTTHERRYLIPDEVGIPHKGMLRLFSRVSIRLTRLIGGDIFSGWMKPALRACSHFRPDDFDVVMGTGMPFITFVIAEKIAKKLNCPLILDYRDAWSDNPHGENNDRKPNTVEESRLTQSAAAIITVSSSLAQLIGNRFNCSEKTLVLMNGYDPDEFRAMPPDRATGFSILYCGRLYPPKRTIDPILEAFRIYLIKGGKGVFHYYGPSISECHASAANVGLLDEVQIHPSISRADVLAIQSQASINTVVTSVCEKGSESEYGIITGKIFDCLGLGKPILVVAPTESDVRAIMEVSGGGKCFSGNEIEKMAAYIADVAEGHNPVFKQPELFTWPNTIIKLDEILRKVIRMHR